MARVTHYHTFDDAPDSALSWGEVIYRASLMLVALVLVATLVNFIYDMSIDLPRIPLAPFVLALAIWLIGRFFRWAMP